jgi:hypothetical protein
MKCLWRMNALEEGRLHYHTHMVVQLVEVDMGDGEVDC